MLAHALVSGLADGRRETRDPRAVRGWHGVAEGVGQDAARIAAGTSTLGRWRAALRRG